MVYLLKLSFEKVALPEAVLQEIIRSDFSVCSSGAPHQTQDEHD